MAQGFARLFTPDEATDRLPVLVPLVEEMMAARTRLVALQPELAPVLEKLLGNGGSRISAAVLESFDRLRASVRGLESHGVLVKDMERGLLDFPAERDGEIVFLCWLYGEKTVSHWHGVDAGFASRRPL